MTLQLIRMMNSRERCREESLRKTRAISRAMATGRSAMLSRIDRIGILSGIEMMVWSWQRLRQKYARKRILKVIRKLLWNLLNLFRKFSLRMDMLVKERHGDASNSVEE